MWVHLDEAVILYPECYFSSLASGVAIVLLLLLLLLSSSLVLSFPLTSNFLSYVYSTQITSEI